MRIRPDVVKIALARSFLIREVPHEMCMTCEKCEGMRHARETGHFTVRLNGREIEEVVRRAKSAATIREQLDRIASIQAGKSKAPDPAPAPKAPKIPVVPLEMRCKEPGCEKEAKVKGVCSAHYQSERRRLLAQGAHRQ